MDRSDATTVPARRPAEAALYACALALAILLGALLWGSLNQPAQAEMVSRTGELVALTARADNQDILYVLDNRAEQLMLYRVQQNNQALELIQSVDLPEYFAAARARRLGGD